MRDINIFVTNLSIPSITLKDNNNAITYHWVRKSIYSGVINTTLITEKSNPCDIPNKQLGAHNNQPLTKELLVLFYSRIEEGIR